MSGRSRAAFRICCALTLTLGTLDLLTTYLCLSRFPTQTYEVNPLMSGLIELTCLPGACLLSLGFLLFIFPKASHFMMTEGKRWRTFLTLLYLVLIPTKVWAVTNNHNIYIKLQQEIYEYHGSEGN